MKRIKEGGLIPDGLSYLQWRLAGKQVTVVYAQWGAFRLRMLGGSLWFQVRRADGSARQMRLA
jgi:hypothetical protein